MKSLQRASYGRRPEADRLAAIVRAEEAALKGDGEKRKSRAFLIVLATASIVALSGITAHRSQSHLVLEGLVRGRVLTVGSPSRARVREVYVQRGDRCEAGDPLVRLQSLEDRNLRERLEIEVERGRLRLELALAGAELGEVDVERHQDRRTDSRAELRQAEDDVRRYTHEAQRLTQQADSLTSEAVNSARESLEVISVLQERLEAARSLADGAVSRLLVVEGELRRFEELHDQGIVSDFEVSRLEERHHRALTEETRCTAEARALEKEIAAAQLEADGAAQTREARLADVELQIRAANEERRAADKRLLSRRQTLSEKELMTEDQPIDVERLRDLEIQLLRAEIQTAETRLAQHDEESGNGILHASSGGLIDEIFLNRGQSVQPGTALLSYIESQSIELVAFATTDDCARLVVGQPCTVRLGGSGQPLSGRVTRMGSAFVPLPIELRDPREPQTSLVLPVKIELAGSVPEGLLLPNRRLQVELTGG